ncbi:hydroxymethylglutaryl-CoA lyase [Thalassobacter stenotrophicus]|uniref:Hydroxymethylglutaryl-CoA lyase YngG n=2 Tax=Thalassobacter stenotrophicus TaxID=266809 RepID=A0A0P1FLH8_9RHOB|nr:hydroxymethylglutaryl-CoA lyase [Thalassobacter stenotrophicus]CUH61591.1 Hydroxymethylglutaryl-CoA lyase YngG [Thalassobacter stenotrophicus]SHJ35033.1 hydroxymethylglutaryl-CoA lyase [Thalassobacter stenotrophicus DSM 16310]
MTQRHPEICEVAPRDGFQSIMAPLPTDEKIAIIRDLAATGCTRIEIGSFVSPKAVPQMADMADIVDGVRDLPARLSALVPNQRGAQAALSAGITDMVYVFSISETHNQNNVRQSVAQSLDGLARIVTDLPARTRLRVDLATAFDCPFDGAIGQGTVLDAVRAVTQIAPHAEVAFCDTTGRANPFVVAARFAAAIALPQTQANTWAFHGHDTFGQGVANAMAAWHSGVNVFDTAAAGLGGCPFAPGATGNTATEDLVFAFNEGGLPTGIDIGLLLQTADRIHALPGGITGSHLRHVPRHRAA